MPPDYVLYDITYENATLYGYATPYYEYDRENDKWDASKDANDPNNFKTSTEGEIFVR